jgi:toluene monooxygenase system ferredoxin subunit
VTEAELWVGEMRGVVAGGEPLLVVREEAGICVYRDRCPHQGARLSEGVLEHGVITCRWHRHTFDAVSGAGINPKAACLVRVPVLLESGRIWLAEPGSTP